MKNYIRGNRKIQNVECLRPNCTDDEVDGYEIRYHVFKTNGSFSLLLRLFANWHLVPLSPNKVITKDKVFGSLALKANEPI